MLGSYYFDGLERYLYIQRKMDTVKIYGWSKDLQREFSFRLPFLKAVT